MPTIKTKLIREYEDVTLEELVDGIPPKRKIQHYMDLIPRLTLPN